MKQGGSGSKHRYLSVYFEMVSTTPAHKILSWLTTSRGYIFSVSETHPYAVTKFDDATDAQDSAHSQRTPNMLRSPSGELCFSVI